MLTIVVSVKDSTVAARLGSAFHNTNLISCHTDQVYETAQRPGVAAIVFGPDALAKLGVGLLLGLRRLMPSLVLIAYLPNDRLLPQLAFELGKTGIDLLWIRDLDDHPAGLLRALEQALTKRLATETALHLTAAAPHLMAAGRWIAEPALKSLLLRAGKIKTARDLAYSLGMSLTRLRSALRGAGLPNPRRFLAWCRLLTAASLLQDENRTVESVALWLDYSSGPAFRNACRKLAHLRPTEIRKGGGLAFC